MSLPQIVASSTVGSAIRVMIVDDAVVVRGLMSRWLSEEPGIEIVGAFRNGREAVDNVLKLNPDICLLDIEMPELDGLAALPLLLARKPNLVVIMASTLTRRNAEVSLKALSLGATDYVAKPETSRELTFEQSYRREIVEKIRILGRHQAPGPLRPRPSRSVAAARAQAISLRPFSSIPPRVLAIGSSTGGPQALEAMVRGLSPVLARLPLVITQHMPSTFTAILAEHLARAANRPAHEGVHGEPLKPGVVYVAPGGKHMKLARQGDSATIVIDDGPPVHFCKPAVDPLFRSAAEAFGASLLAVVLTGMGTDGTEGAASIAAAGGSTIAQDETTSVVWGMPGSAAHSGHCSAVLPLDEIAPKIVRLVNGDRA
ncbi:MAG TPA: chemotaxis response regulator protein-glutamate methylesterase [Xanthobacteraceae bacterium]|nr:chemotaxis response regulator protein-glutamate methylesterase [Xanthobacteraceae bacterium]